MKLSNSHYRTLTRQISVAALLLASSLLPATLQAQVIALDKVIAIVDSDVVMASELNQRMGMVIAQLRAKDAQMPSEEEIRSQLIEQLVSEALQLQIGRRAGIEISEAQLDQHIQRMIESNKLSQAQFEQQLAADGLSLKNLKKQIRRDMIIEQVQRGSVNRRIRISDQEVKNFLKSKQGKFWSSPDYQLGHILIPSAANNAAGTAANIVEKLRSGADFRQLAATQSKGQNALEGGDLGWRKAAEMPELFVDTISTMEKGEISDPLRSGAGYHIVKVYDIRGAQEQIIPQAKARHILVKPSAILSDEQAQQKLAGIRQQILKGADFAELAKDNSEDTGSMLSGGDLGWSLPGKFVPAFEAAMQATKTGDISAPFRSQFGWHILRVDERREQDMSDTVRLNQARRLMSNRRFEEERHTWLREIRDQAYVEVK